MKGLHGRDERYVKVSSGCKVVTAHSGPENIPKSRFSFDSKVTERDMRLTFLPNVEACIEAGTYNLMCSYNRLKIIKSNFKLFHSKWANLNYLLFNSINGIPACANKYLLTDVLRNEFGFNGYFISDEGAIEYIMTVIIHFS